MIKGKLNNNNQNDENKEENHDEKIDDSVATVVADSKINDENTNKKTKIFEKLTIKDIVFLAIVGAVLIVTCSVMAIVSGFTLTIFAVGQVATSLQLSLFITVGLIKVRKPFAMTFIMMFMGAIMVLMSPIMFFSNIFVMLVVEMLIIIIFKGYKTNKACIVAGALTGPLSIITPTIYNIVVATEGYTALDNTGMVIGMTLVVIALSVIGSLIGFKIGTELEKAGALKNNEQV